MPQAQVRGDRIRRTRVDADADCRTGRSPFLRFSRRDDQDFNTAGLSPGAASSHLGREPPDVRILGCRWTAVRSTVRVPQKRRGAAKVIAIFPRSGEQRSCSNTVTVQDDGD